MTSFILFVFRQGGQEGGREGEREGENQCVVVSHTSPLGTWPATQACALTGNWTSDPLVCRPALNLLSHSSQGLAWLLNTWNRILMTKMGLLLKLSDQRDVCSAQGVKKRLEKKNWRQKLKKKYAFYGMCHIVSTVHYTSILIYPFVFSLFLFFLKHSLLFYFTYLSHIYFENYFLKTCNFLT